MADFWNNAIGTMTSYFRLGKGGVRLKDDDSGNLLVRNPDDSAAADGTVAALRLVDIDASHTLGLVAGSNLTANRTLMLTTGDANRTLTMTGDASVSGTHTGTSSGTNTGDQTITLTGNVTGSGTGSFAATIANDAVTNAKAANMATQTIKGRNTAGTGDPEDLSVATVQSMLGVPPAGTVLSFAGSTTPTGWLDCDGAAVSRTTYSALFTAIGTTWGAGNGSTTFNVPDLRGRTAIGVGQGSSLTNRTLGQTGGAETHTLSTDEMPTHTHATPVPHGGPGGSYANLYSAADNSSAFFNATSSSAGGGAAHANMQPWAALKAIIKT